MKLLAEDMARRAARAWATAPMNPSRREMSATVQAAMVDAAYPELAKRIWEEIVPLLDRIASVGGATAALHFIDDEVVPGNSASGIRFGDFRVRHGRDASIEILLGTLAYPGSVPCLPDRRGRTTVRNNLCMRIIDIARAEGFDASFPFSGEVSLRWVDVSDMETLYQAVREEGALETIDSGVPLSDLIA